MRVLKIGLALALLLTIAVGGIVWSSQQPLIPRVEAPPRSAFDPADVAKGAGLAALGDCDVCHTASGGSNYAGGRPIATPFGTIYSSNITPAIGTGLGHWSENAFRRAMRDGVSRRGEHLFPAFPYDHFTHIDDADIHALYAFIMTRQPVENFVSANRLIFPFNQRWLMSFWDLLFLDHAAVKSEPQQSAEWNRGAYLVEGLGHCGACHTPRNALGAEKTGEALAGGEAEGWVAPALNTDSPAPVPWDAAHLSTYLRQGWDAEHGAAAGPMQPVTHDLARADEGDIRAIAAYLATLPGNASPQRRERADKALALASAEAETPAPPAGGDLGATLFAGACASCHVGGPAMVPPHGIDLSLSTVVNQSDPRNAIRILLYGIRSDGERSGPWMPRFAGAFTDAQLAALLTYIRGHYSSGPSWADLAGKVADVRHSGTQP
ncbi:MAG TPA: cytochrome c [Stellaceae bacterium]|jgi:mono/diheme cytochrome c family protein|nr:cytochrome c [Stellaceae bacterium]